MTEKVDDTGLAKKRSDRRVYLDYALRCPLRADAVEFWKTVCLLPQGLPVSPHKSGRLAGDFLEECRHSVGKVLGCDTSKNVRFFSSFVMAAHRCFDAAAANSASNSRVVFLGAAESPTVRQAAVSWACLRGWSVREVACDASGCCNLSMWTQAIRENQFRGGIAVCCSANSEVGTLQPGQELAVLARDAGLSLVRDVSSTFCWASLERGFFEGSYILCSAARMGAADFGSFVVFTGEPPEHQEPEPVSLAGAIRAVTEGWFVGGFGKEECMRRLRQLFVADLHKRLPELVQLGPQEEERRLPNVLGLRIPGVESEALSLVCDLRGVEFSHSPACVADAVRESHFLLALGLSAHDVRECISLSLGPGTTQEEILFAALTISDAAFRVKGI